MSPLAQRIIEVRDEVDAARATGRLDSDRVAFLTGLEAAGWLAAGPVDRARLVDDLRRRETTRRALGPTTF